MKKFLVFLIVLGLSMLVFGQPEKKPFSIEALYELKSVYDVQPSPDGKWIAYVVTDYNLKETKQNSDIYISSIDGKIQKRLTTYSGADFHPRWSKKGDKIYFLSTRKNGVQLWALPVLGGEAVQLTDFDGISMDNVHYLEDSNKIIFTTTVFPECGEDLECSKKIRDSRDNGPVQAHYAKELLYRHWTSYRDGEYTHVFMYDFDSKQFKALTSGQYDYPMFSLGGPQLAVSPDGNEICVVSNHDKEQASSTNGDLWLINMSTGELKNITKENPAYDGEPVYSPDGRYIAFKTQKIPGYESDLFRLAIYDRKTGKISNLTEGKIDNWVGSVVWSKDSKNIYFTVEEKGHYPVYKIELKSGKIKKIFDANTIRSLTLTPDQKYFVFTRSTVGSPYEIYRIKSNGKQLEQITFINQDVVEQYDIRPAREMWITGADGKKIQTWVVTPHNFDPNKKYPLILNVHGGPQQMWYDGFRGDWQVYPGSGYVVAFCNPHGSPGYGQKFVEAISKDWGGKVYEDIMKVTDSLASLPYVDENRLGAMGWSYGGYMMMWLEGHTDRFKAIVAMMGVYDLPSMYGTTEELWFPEWEMGGTPWDKEEMYKKWSPSSYVKNFKTPCLVITGERDYRVSYTQSLQFFTALQKMNVPSELIVFKHDGHWPNYLKSMPVYYNAHLYWFHKYLGGEEAPYEMDKLIQNRAFEEK
ncbi:MAG: S9 family peptidase [Calditrichia bacterium]